MRGRSSNTEKQNLIINPKKNIRGYLPRVFRFAEISISGYFPASLTKSISPVPFKYLSKKAGTRTFIISIVLFPSIGPRFVMAYLGLAHSYRYLAKGKARSEAMEKVMALADRANPKEKLYIQAWHARYVEEDIGKRTRIMKEIVEKYPKEKEAHSWLGMDNQGINDDEVIREYQTVLELDPHHAIALGQISPIFCEMGDFEKALDYANRYVAASPNNPTRLGDYLAYIYLRMGQPDLAIEKCREALSIKPDFYFALGNIVDAYGLKED